MNLIARLLIASALLLMAAAPVSAKPSKTLVMTEGPDCSFTLTYTWNGMGGKSDLNVWLVLSGHDASGSARIDFEGTSPVSGKGGTFSSTFVSTESYPYQYQGYAYLQSGGRAIARSEIFTDLTQAKSCAVS